MTDELLRRVTAQEMPGRTRDPVDGDTLAAAAVIVNDVRHRGEAALREHAERLGDVAPGEPLIRTRQELLEALDSLPEGQRHVLEHTAERISTFAEAQRDCLTPLTVAMPGGSAGHTIRAVDRAGCYAPGGRFPLPSSVLMTAVTARVAGVAEVWVASPRPAAVTLAAAAIAGADAVLAVGGAQAIAALAFGAGPVPACSAVVGPGNRWVTAAKQLVAGRVAIDMLAGPSELVVLADARADASLIAADLLAQAEHDPDALPVLIALSEDLITEVEAELHRQLATLPTAETARAALRNGFAMFASTMEEAIAACNDLAPEHLEVLISHAPAVASKLLHYGGLFIGPGSAEVLGDYGAGPNHVLPTGGTARFTGGLSVFTFLAVRTWLRVDDPSHPLGFVAEAAELARLEGLEGHARAAERRGGRMR